MTTDTDILISLGQTIPADQLRARWLHSDQGLIYVSFDTSINSTFKEWWLDVLASADALLEPEFAVVPYGSDLAQVTIKQVSADTVGGNAAGIYYSSYITQTSPSGTTSVTRGNPEDYSIEIAESAFSHSINFADSREAGWKSVAFHELGHALGLEHSHDSDDGDSDTTIDTNQTVMSYVSAIDTDGDPGYTELDRRALIKIHGAETGALAKPVNGAIAVRDLANSANLGKTWKTPALKAEFEGGSAMNEPISGIAEKRLIFTRYDGYLGSEARVYLDWTKSDSVKWTYTNPTSGFHDVLIPANEVIFKPGESTASVTVTLFADDNLETTDWLEVRLRAAREPNYFQAFPDTSLRLNLNDPVPSFALALSTSQSIADLVKTVPKSLMLVAGQARDLNPSDGATINISAPGWSDTIQLIRISKADAAGSRLQTRQPESGFGTKVGSLIVGSDGNDVITGGFGWDIADGGAGNDLVKTGNGRDILTGGLGADELWGGFGWNTFRSEIDGSMDRLVIRSDQWLVNPRQNSTAGNNADGSKADVIEGLDSNDRITIQGVVTADISIRAGASTPAGVTGIGIYANGALEGIYTGNNLSISQLQAMVTGDNSKAAIDNTIVAYGSGWVI